MSLLAVPAAAQDSEPTRYRITLGAQVKPQFPGADDVKVQPMFDFDRARGDAPFEFEAPDDSFGFNLIDGPFEFGPAVSMVSPRKAKDVGAAVPKVARTFEVGAYANLWLGRASACTARSARQSTGMTDGWPTAGRTSWRATATNGCSRSVPE